MRRLLAGCLLLLFAASGSPVRANPGPRPDEWRFLKTTANRGDRLEWTCDASRPDFSAFSALSVGGRSRNFGTRRTSEGDTYIATKIGTAPVAHTIQEGSTSHWGGNGTSRTIEADGTVIRAAWARWGGDYACALRINGVARTLRRGNPARSRYVMWTDLTGIAVASNYGGGGAGLFERRTEGFLFAWLTPGNGVARAEGPEGEDELDADVIFSSVAIARKTNGLWRYTVAGARETSGIVMWLMELPA